MKRLIIAAAILLTINSAGAAEPDYVFKHISPACKDKAVITQIVELMESGDTAAWKSELGRQMERGECIGFREGARVYMIDTALFKGLAKVRKKGTAASFWAPMEAIRALN